MSDFLRLLVMLAELVVGLIAIVVAVGGVFVLMWILYMGAEAALGALR